MTISLAKIRENIEKEKLDALLISSVSNITYLTNYSGFSKDEREAFLLITKSKQYIITDGRYSTAVKKLIPDFKLLEISANNSMKEILKTLKTKRKIKKLGIEENDLKVSEYNNLKKYFGKMYHWEDSHSLRSIKAKDEISKIEKACQLGDKVFEYVLEKIYPGISEKEVANELEFFIKRNGGDISFKSIVAFGANSAIPHHQTSDKRLAISDKFILLDFGVKLDNYCSDMTRTIFLGKPTASQKKIYETVLKAQAKAIDAIARHHTEFISTSQIDKSARDYIISKDYETIPHSLGHGIGIEVHEAPHLSPRSEDILKESMVFSIEPGIYIPNFGGVRIEDLVVLEKSGPRLLTHSRRDIIEI